MRDARAKTSPFSSAAVSLFSIRNNLAQIPRDFHGNLQSASATVARPFRCQLITFAYALTHWVKVRILYSYTCDLSWTTIWVFARTHIPAQRSGSEWRQSQFTEVKNSTKLCTLVCGGGGGRPAFQAGDGNALPEKFSADGEETKNAKTVVCIKA